MTLGRSADESEREEIQAWSASAADDVTRASRASRSESSAGFSRRTELLERESALRVVDGGGA